MFIRIIGIRRCLSSTASKSRIPELKQGAGLGLRKTALTGPGRVAGQKEYTQKQYQDFLSETYNPKVYVSDPRKNLSDMIRADHRDAMERFRNRKLTAQRTHGRDERIAHVANSTMPEKIKNKKIVRPSHDWNSQYVYDKRYQYNF